MRLRYPSTTRVAVRHDVHNCYRHAVGEDAVHLVLRVARELHRRGLARKLKLRARAASSGSVRVAGAVKERDRTAAAGGAGQRALVLLVRDSRFDDGDGEHVADTAGTHVLEQVRIPRVTAVPNGIRTPRRNWRSSIKSDRREKPSFHGEPPISTSTVEGPVTCRDNRFFGIDILYLNALAKSPFLHSFADRLHD